MVEVEVMPPAGAEELLKETVRGREGEVMPPAGAEELL
jgi:hypothetical protein